MNDKTRLSFSFFLYYNAFGCLGAAGRVALVGAVAGAAVDPRLEEAALADVPSAATVLVNTARVALLTCLGVRAAVRDVTAGSESSSAGGSRDGDSSGHGSRESGDDEGLGKHCKKESLWGFGRRGCLCEWVIDRCLPEECFLFSLYIHKFSRKCLFNKHSHLPAWDMLLLQAPLVLTSAQFVFKLVFLHYIGRLP